MADFIADINLYSPLSASILFIPHRFIPMFFILLQLEYLKYYKNTNTYV